MVTRLDVPAVVGMMRLVAFVVWTTQTTVHHATRTSVATVAKRIWKLGFVNLGHFQEVYVSKYVFYCP